MAATLAMVSLGAQEQKKDRPAPPKDAVVTTTFKTQEEAVEALSNILNDKGFEIQEGERFVAFAPKPEKPAGKEGDKPEKGERPDNLPDFNGQPMPQGPGGPGRPGGPGPRGPMRPGVFANFQVENGVVVVTLSGTGRWINLQEIAEALPNTGITWAERKRPERADRPGKGKRHHGQHQHQQGTEA